MSFILEALKKSDKKRQEGTVPKLETIHAPAETVTGRRWRWGWSLVLVLLLNVAVLFWVFGPWRHPAAKSVTKGQVSEVAEKPMSVSKAALDSQQRVVSEAREEIKELSAPVRPQAVEEKSPAATELIRQQPVAPEAVSEPLQSESLVRSLRTEDPQTTQMTEPTVAAERIFQLAELPLAVRNRIPELHMSLHAYNRTSAAASLVRINDQILREGMSLDRLRLEEITAEGVAFRFEGYRFLLPRH